jgi:hypothetical protein
VGLCRHVRLRCHHPRHCGVSQGDHSLIDLPGRIDGAWIGQGHALLGCIRLGVLSFVNCAALVEIGVLHSVRRAAGSTAAHLRVRAPCRAVDARMRLLAARASLDAPSPCTLLQLSHICGASCVDRCLRIERVEYCATSRPLHCCRLCVV